MSTNDGARHNGTEAEDRSRELKRQAAQAAKGKMTAWESGSLSAERREQFWRYVAEFETAPSTSGLRQLIDAGLELPEPDGICDEELTSKLWEVIGALAEMRVFVSETDHLSDRELYNVLWHDVLREETSMLPDDLRSTCHLNLLSSGSEADTYLYLKHYADEEWRQHWQDDFPDYDIPAHEDPPFDRDRHLPQPVDGAW